MTEPLSFMEQALIDSGAMLAPEPIEPTPTTPVAEPTPTPIEPTPADPTPTPTPIEPTPTPTPAEFQITDEISLKVLNEKLGTNYSSLDEVNALRTDLAELPTLKERASVPQVKFHSDSIKEFNAFASATGIEDATVLRELKKYTNTESKNPIDALVLAKIIENPAFADKKDLLRETFMENYNLEVDENEDPALEARRIEKVKLKMDMDAQGANQLISTTMGKVNEYKSVEDTSSTQAIQAKTENQSAWKSVLADNKFTNLFNSISVEVPLGKYDGETDLGTETVNIELDATDRAQILAEIQKAVESGAVPCTQEVVEATIELHQARLIKKNFSQVMAKGMTQAIGRAKEEWEKKITNPSALKIETPLSTEKKTSMDEALEAMAKNFIPSGR